MEWKGIIVKVADNIEIEAGRIRTWTRALWVVISSVVQFSIDLHSVRVIKAEILSFFTLYLPQINIDSLVPNQFRKTSS